MRVARPLAGQQPECAIVRSPLTAAIEEAMPALVLAFAMLVLTPQDIGKVTSTFDKSGDFGALKTYAWEAGHRAHDPVAHKTIVDAMDAQMAALGYAQADRASADVLLKYHTVRGSYVDLKELEERQRRGETEPAKAGILGRLVVVLFKPASTTTPLWQASLREHLSDDVATRTREIETAVTALFQTYPGRRR
jgi:hypothetical protein